MSSLRLSLYTNPQNSRSYLPRLIKSASVVSVGSHNAIRWILYFFSYNIYLNLVETAFSPPPFLSLTKVMLLPCFGVLVLHINLLYIFFSFLMLITNDMVCSSSSLFVYIYIYKASKRCNDFLLVQKKFKTSNVT